MSINSFERYIKSDLRVVRRGELRLYVKSDLDEWLEANAKYVFDPQRASSGAKEAAA